MTPIHQRSILAGVLKTRIEEPFLKYFQAIENRLWSLCFKHFQEIWEAKLQYGCRPSEKGKGIGQKV